MKKPVFIAVLAAVALSAATALEVDQPEIRSAGGEGTIQFENYTGPYTTVDTLDAIRSIGRGLGQNVSRSVTRRGTFDLNGKYSVIHAVDTTTDQKLDADILIIGQDAAVDHIRNLRYIIAAYLTSAYGYSDRDAATIATFATIYNAVYRGRLDVFRDRYKDVVTQNLTQDKCGLSTRWSDWPGNSQIVIPLSDLSGGLSTVDTSVISDRDVIDTMREDDDRGIDDRKDMVDLKEREADEAQQKADDAQKDADDKQKAADDAQKAADDAQKAADDAKKAADDAQKAADNAQKDADKKADDAASNPTDRGKQQQADDAQKAADDAQKAADDAKKAADEEQQKADDAQKAADDAQKAADDAQKEADRQQQRADQKADEAQQERQDIAKDQQEVIDRTVDTATGSDVVIGLTSTSGTYSQMVKLDVSNGTLVKQSPVTVIRGKTILPAGAVTVTDAKGAVVSAPAYMAICGGTGQNSAVKLCILDGNNMEIQAQSTENVADNSVLVQNGSDYYCILNDGGTYHVGRFDSSLKLQQRSPVAVSPESPITVTPKGIVVTGANGVPLLLKLDGMTQVTD